MDTTERYNLIASIARKKPIRFKAKTLRVSIEPTKKETETEIKLASRHNDDDSVLDVEANVEIISPLMAKVTGEAVRINKAHPGDEALTPAERRQLARDVNEYRLKQKPTFDPRFWLWIPPVNALCS